MQVQRSVIIAEERGLPEVQSAGGGGEHKSTQFKGIAITVLHSPHSRGLGEESKVTTRALGFGTRREGPHGEVDGSWWSSLKAALQRRAHLVVDPLSLGRGESDLIRRARVILHLTLRPPARWFAVVGASDGLRARRLNLARAVIGTAWDVIEARRLQWNPRTRTLQRAAVDLVDVAVGLRSTQAHSGLSPIVGAPLIVEDALLYGAPAAALPAAHLIAGAIAERRSPSSRVFARYLTQFAALVGGLGLRKFEQERARELQQELDREFSRRANLERRLGRYHVATAIYRDDGGARESAFDVLGDIRVRIARERIQHGSPLWQIQGGRKAELWNQATATGETVDLRTAFIEIKNVLNTDPARSNPADQLYTPNFLDADVGMVVLTAAQQRALHDFFVRTDRENFRRGTVTVAVVEADRPGHRVVLSIDGAQLVLPADRRDLGRLRWADPTPAALALAAVWAAGDGTKVFHDVGVKHAAPGFLGFTIGTVWATRRIRQRGRNAHAEVALAAAGVGMVHLLSVTSGLRGRRVRPDGNPSFPGEIASKGPAIALGFLFDSLLPTERRPAVLPHLALASLGILMAPKPRHWGNVVLGQSWNVLGFLAARRYRRMTEESSQELAAEYAALHEAFGESTRAAAEREEWLLVTRAVEQCQELLADDPDPQLHQELHDLREFALARSGKANT